MSGRPWSPATWAQVCAVAVLSMCAACQFDASGFASDSADSADGDGADADPEEGDIRAACEDAGGTLMVGTCAFVCAAGDPDCDFIRCPPGMPCDVQCAAGACRCGVDCADAAGCTVACEGDAACEGGVTCGGASCEIVCEGPDACAGGVRCSGSACDVNCRGDNACEQGACCADAACVGTGQQCKPQAATCVGMCGECQ